MAINSNIPGQQGNVIWLSGLPCSGKTTIGSGLEELLKSEGFVVRMLDGDISRKGICNDLGFSEFDRKENIRRIAEIAKLFAETGVITICAYITPTEELRQLSADIIGQDRLIQVFVDTPVDVCEQRDVKGMYKKARQGEIKEFTGVSAPFERPTKSQLTLRTVNTDPSDSIRELYNYLIPIIKLHEK